MRHSVEEYRESIARIVEKTVYHLGNNGEIGGQYIIEALAKRKKKK